MKKIKVFGVMVVLIAAMTAIVIAATPRIDWYDEPKTDKELNGSVTYEDLKIRNTGNELFYLSYYHNAFFEDGTVVYSQFFIHNLGPGSLHPTADLTVIEPDGSVHRRVKTPGKVVPECAENKFRVAFGDFSIEGDPAVRPSVYRLKSRYDENFGIDLTYTCEAPPFYDKGFYLNDDKNDYQRWVTYCPRGGVEGTVTVNGKSRKVKGRGFGDHAVTNPSISSGKPTLSDIGIFIRGSNPDFGFSLMEYRPIEGGKGIHMPGILVNVGDKNVIFTRDYGLKLVEWREKDGTKFPSKFAIEINKPGFKMKGVIEMERYLLSGSVLESVDSKALRFMMSKLVGDSKWARFVCGLKFYYNYEERNKTTEGKAITQVMLSGAAR